MKPVCDSCGKKPTPKGGLAGFGCVATVEGKRFGIVARLCSRGCAEQMRLYIRSHRTTEPPELKTMWGGDKLRPLQMTDYEVVQ